MEYHNAENLDEFIQELKGIYLETDMNKKDAEEELAGTKEELTRFMNQFNKDPRRAHPNLTECERASLAQVGPNVNLGEEEFYFPENVPPLTSTSKLNQDPDIRSSYRLD